jgi:two-component system sensor histidine kinase RegB
MTTTTLPPEEHITLLGLVRLRWGVLLCQLLASLVLGVRDAASVPLWALVPSVLLAASNLWLRAFVHRPSPQGVHVMGAVLVVDTLLWTAFFALSGGHSNPFAVLYLVHVTLAAAVLSPSWTWAVVVLSVLGYGALFLGAGGGAAPVHAHHQAPSEFDAHLQGMWLGFTLAAVLIAAFVGRVSSSLRQWQHQVVLLRERNARNEKLASLTTMAAGAAHQLATPLSTIAVVARELERHLQEHGPLGDDARLIRSEVERCRSILDRLNRNAGGSQGEAPVTLPLGNVLQDAATELPVELRQRLDVGTTTHAMLTVPRHALTQSMCLLLSNAFDATPVPGRVALEARVDGTHAIITVRDTGAGMAPETLTQAGVPFFSTKPSGQGMGLGLFVARRLAEDLGGSLDIHSVQGQGTEVSVTLPLQVPA